MAVLPGDAFPGGTVCDTDCLDPPAQPSWPCVPSDEVEIPVPSLYPCLITCGDNYADPVEYWNFTNYSSNETVTQFTPYAQDVRAYSIDYSPDGKYVAVALWQDSVALRIYDVSTGVWQEVAALYTGLGRHVRFSPNGNYVAIAISNSPGGTYNGINIVQTSNWASIFESSGTGQNQATYLAWSNDSNLIAFDGRKIPEGNRRLVIYSLGLANFVPDNWGNAQGGGQSPMSFTTNDAFVLAEDNVLGYVYFDMATLQITANVLNGYNIVSAEGLEATPDGNYIIVCGGGGGGITLQVFDAATLNVVGPIPGIPTGPTVVAQGLAVRQDGSEIALVYTIDAGRILWRWDTTDPNPANWSLLPEIPGEVGASIRDDLAYSDLSGCL